MEYYDIEAKSSSMKGKIVVGAAEGYDGTGRRFTLEQAAEVLGEVNKDIAREGRRTIPCIITPGLLVGRAGDEGYKEEMYTLGFSWSPRSEQMEDNEFRETLIIYAEKIGKEMGQKRVYVEFKGEETVLKQKQEIN